jgi:MATE family multidrug resistance protein
MAAIEETPGSGLAQVLRMSWPASLTMLNSTLMKFVDGFMVSRVGAVPFAAQYAAGMTSFVPESFVMGLLTVVNTYVSQNFGAGRPRRTAPYAWAGLLLAVAAGAVLAPLALGARPLFGLLASFAAHRPPSPELIALETVYFRYMILTVGVTLSCRVLEQFFFGVHRPRVVLVASIVANLFNVAANAVLIFGLLGFPALGLEGAAIGTVLSWGIQLLILLVVFLSRPTHRRFSSRSIAAVRPRHCAELLRLGWPAGVQLCNDIATWAVFSVWLVGWFGEAHLAASTAVMRYLGISFMPAVGIGIAITALVGRHIGEARLDLARRRTHTGLLVAMAYMGLCGAAFWLFRYPMVSLFVKLAPEAAAPATEAQQLAGEIVQIGATILLCAAVFQLFDAVGIVFIGALRGAGDTLWPMIVTICMSWAMVLGGGVLAVWLLPGLGSVGPWAAASAYVVAQGVVMAWRFESGAWRKIDLLKRQAGPGLAPPAQSAGGA